eukprot:CAMPEP_0174250566 /NCGR_PEP_ID=MMETSP0439-20130205/701_1 /TAXON_ID=0 /ORGANISM="Stereomyxa ramosa, Strain Chinc5" /LENGTH=754 /DNA_ID=CAMNT_0015330681 /DNA_START=198 /DNA_END=2462 /DNA_ORIENTATION=+
MSGDSDSRRRKPLTNGTPIPQIIASPTTLTAKDSPYVLDSQVQLFALVTVEPGVSIIVDRNVDGDGWGSFTFRTGGDLLIRGSPSLPVLLSSTSRDPEQVPELDLTKWSNYYRKCERGSVGDYVHVEYLDINVCVEESDSYSRTDWHVSNSTVRLLRVRRKFSFQGLVIENGEIKTPNPKDDAELEFVKSYLNKVTLAGFCAERQFGSLDRCPLRFVESVVQFGELDCYRECESYGCTDLHFVSSQLRCLGSLVVKASVEDSHFTFGILGLYGGFPVKRSSFVSSNYSEQDDIGISLFVDYVENSNFSTNGGVVVNSSVSHSYFSFSNNLYLSGEESVVNSSFFISDTKGEIVVDVARVKNSNFKTKGHLSIETSYGKKNKITHTTFDIEGNVEIPEHNSELVSLENCTLYANHFRGNAPLKFTDVVAIFKGSAHFPQADIYDSYINASSFLFGAENSTISDPNAVVVFPHLDNPNYDAAPRPTLPVQVDEHLSNSNNNPLLHNNVDDYDDNYNDDLDDHPYPNPNPNLNPNPNPNKAEILTPPLVYSYTNTTSATNTTFNCDLILTHSLNNHTNHTNHTNTTGTYFLIKQAFRYNTINCPGAQIYISNHNNNTDQHHRKPNTTNYLYFMYNNLVNVSIYQPRTSLLSNNSLTDTVLVTFSEEIHFNDFNFRPTPTRPYAVILGDPANLNLSLNFWHSQNSSYIHSLVCDVYCDISKGLAWVTPFLNDTPFFGRSSHLHVDPPSFLQSILNWFF